MKGGLVGWLASESFGVVVGVIASTEMMSAVEEGRLSPDLTSKTTGGPTAAVNRAGFPEAPTLERMEPFSRQDNDRQRDPAHPLCQGHQLAAGRSDRPRR